MKLEIGEIYLMKRKRLKITLDEVAAYLGCNKSSISRWENGKMKFRLEKQYMNYIDQKEINK
ncbi:hypothetical protein GCM10009865_47410 [Aeromicrobium ponti]|uniref:Helix-turn-helix protein n=1 Tax=Cytobacillus oceanisediminis TaxID=665099 RepID=A0A562JCV3_9BACI|nr:helix-turn-helix transcriptional regulator [Cytobacillus oceanisediminis]TWH81016.1 helix-turn-helix protein [Cytobacillus oceanisediminis]